MWFTVITFGLIALIPIIQLNALCAYDYMSKICIFFQIIQIIANTVQYFVHAI